MPWVVAAIAAFAAWFGVSFAILALDRTPSDAAALLVSTAQLGAAITLAWLVQSTLDEDASSGFVVAADAAASGPGGRWMGRWGGALVASWLCGSLAVMVAALATKQSLGGALLLWITSIVPLAVHGAWALLAAVHWRGGAALGVVLLIWFLGHLPWGRPPVLEGLLGQMLRAWLPTPRAIHAPWAHAPAALLTTLGLLWLAMHTGRERLRR